ncbi:MAG: hypothetical protein KDK99_18225 [Verrucomicrobiales bacterium]|nr:hypothetical protein [Verrucomicrobiales bacterium]
MRWLLIHPLSRSAIPAIVGAVVGLMTNFVAGAVQVSGKVMWSDIHRQTAFWIGMVVLGLGIFYQKKVHETDRESRSVLEESKEGLAESLGTFYAEKIAAGDIDELEVADKKLRKIFKKKP